MPHDKMGSLEFDTSLKTQWRERDRIKPLADALVNEAGWKVYVSPEMARADLKNAEERFALSVKADTKGRLKGEIRGYDAEGGAPTSGDMRDTWALTLVDPKTKQVVDFWQFAPLGDPDHDWDYEHERATELAAQVEAGTLTREKALKQMTDLMQADAEGIGTSEVETIVDSLRFEEMFPKYERWLAANRSRSVEMPQPSRRPHKVWSPRTFQRPVPVRSYWRKGMRTFVESHKREHPRRG